MEPVSDRQAACRSELNGESVCTLPNMAEEHQRSDSSVVLSAVFPCPPRGRLFSTGESSNRSPHELTQEFSFLSSPHQGRLFLTARSSDGFTSPRRTTPPISRSVLYCSNPLVQGTDKPDLPKFHEGIFALDVGAMVGFLHVFKLYSDVVEADPVNGHERVTLPSGLDDQTLDFPAPGSEAFADYEDRLSSLLRRVADMLYVKMFQHKGHPELYTPVLQMLADYVRFPATFWPPFSHLLAAVS